MALAGGVLDNADQMSSYVRRLLFVLFFVSGFCSLLYQVVWTRMAFASFGIITPVLSVVLSVFMLGLSVGSWAGGRFIIRWVGKTGLSAAFFYAGGELLIGLGALVVPKLFKVGEHFLLSAGQTDSVGYLFFSAAVLVMSILPWCVFMGGTFPFIMAYVRECEPDSSKSFSFLYLANVLGAMSGTFLTAIVLVEMLGFRHTLWVAAAGNFSIALLSGWLGLRQQGCTPRAEPESGAPSGPAVCSQMAGSRSRLTRWILFSTGFCAMAMEVVWTRAFTPWLKTQVYSFALIVFTYLGATLLGSAAYRRDLRGRPVYSTAELISFLTAAALLPIVATDPRLVRWLWRIGVAVSEKSYAVLALAGICPLCATLGYLTPRLIDEYACGQPAEAGKVYALNVVGCILGPLFASYVLLPLLRERYALILLCLPFLVFSFLTGNSLSPRRRLVAVLAAGTTLVWSLFVAVDFQGLYSMLDKTTVVRRDYTASVLSVGSKRDDKQLLVNGIGMTSLTPITKFMVHLPLAFHQGQPKSVLIICFGMGTTYRSALSWNVDVTAVELVPSVRDAFRFYHADAARVLRNAKGRIVIDDGRRYLNRSREKFDVIVIDPPPPIEAAGSSLLYSKEFYAVAKEHLEPNGILQVWFPGGVERASAQAVLRSVDESFPYVRCFHSLINWGTHVLASLDPIEQLNTEELAARLPEDAKKDLMEWAPSENVPDYLRKVLSRETPIKRALNPNVAVQITDDTPFNEYFLLRKSGLTWH